MIERTIVFLPNAQADIDDSAEFIALDNINIARRFVAAAEEAFRKLADMPNLGSLREFHHPGFKQMRSWRIRGFENWLVFYRPITDGIEIIRVLHGARDLDDLFEVSE